MAIGRDPPISSVARPEGGPMLEDGARVVVVGGGPAGSFFALEMLRLAAARGRRLELTVLERRRGMTITDPTPPQNVKSCCNFCAGGISPRMNDVLEELGIEIPSSIIQNRVMRITVQSHWKNIELKVPEGRRMYSVYRGSRPRGRDDRHLNFDSLLLGAAADRGARVVCGDVTGLSRSPGGRPRVDYLDKSDARTEVKSMDADFLVFAGGVNRVPGMDLDSAPVVADLRRLMPGFVPPKTCRTMIFELELERDLVEAMEGELYFVLYGSRDLTFEMGSVMPKGRFLTVVLVGGDVDSGGKRKKASEIVSAFLRLPHVRRIVPGLPVRPASCTCGPNMVVGAAKNPFGERVAVVGDMVISRLYKDGIYTAYLTASGLARSVFESGVGAAGIGKGYGAVVRDLEKDHRYGRLVFLLNTLLFRRPGLSRMTYQAVLRERRLMPRGQRRLEGVLWRIASGDDSYKSILRAMLHPMTLLLVLIRGVFVTIRNVITELVFGLSWRGFGRYPTGIYREEFEARIRDLTALLDIDLSGLKDVARMYSIRVRGTPAAVFRELGRLGDPGRGYLKPRFVDIRRIRGGENEVGSILRYRTMPEAFSLDLELERRNDDNLIIYRVVRGFAEGGVLIFKIEQRTARDCLLSVLTAFNFRGGRGWLRGSVLTAVGRVFPTFVHDVLWNHAMCQIKHVIESPGAADRGQSELGLRPLPTVGG